jgi:hypothetical protein
LLAPVADQESQIETPDNEGTLAMTSSAGTANSACSSPWLSVTVSGRILQSCPKPYGVVDLRRPFGYGRDP